MADQDSQESVGTVVVAAAANLAVAAAKALAGFLSGSSAMLSEAVHSLADTITEVLLFIALRRGGRPADTRHPFGYGKATFFWAFLAALCTFAVGAGFSLTHGVQTIVGGEDPGDFALSYLVLAVSFAIEGVSLTRAVRQVRREARHWNVSSARYLRHTADTTVKAVTLEDLAALTGIVIAAAGLAITELSGSTVWDGVASIAIGVLLLTVAAILARANSSLLFGQAVPPGLWQEIREEILDVAGVERVLDLQTMLLGRDSVLVAATVDFLDTESGAGVEAAADEADRRLRARFPAIRYVFLDPSGR